MWVARIPHRPFSALRLCVQVCVCPTAACCAVKSCSSSIPLSSFSARPANGYAHITGNSAMAAISPPSKILSNSTAKAEPIPSPMPSKPPAAAKTPCAVASASTVRNPCLISMATASAAYPSPSACATARAMPRAISGIRETGRGISSTRRPIRLCALPTTSRVCITCGYTRATAPSTRVPDNTITVLRFSPTASGIRACTAGSLYIPIYLLPSLRPIPFA